MKRTRATSGVAAVVLALGMILPATYACTARTARQRRAAENVDILQKVRSAKTAADHQQIESYYDTQAAEAKKNADQHRKMAATYQAGGTAIGRGLGPVPLPQHCQALAKTFDEEAAHYTAMADTHRELAKSIK